MSSFTRHVFSQESKIEFTIPSLYNCKVRITNIPSYQHLIKLEHELCMKVERKIFITNSTEIIEIDFNNRDAMIDLFERLNISLLRYEYVFEESTVVNVYIVNSPNAWNFSLIGMSEERLVRLFNIIGHNGYMPVANHIYISAHPKNDNKIISSHSLRRMNCTYNINVLVDDAEGMADFIEIAINNSEDVVNGKLPAISKNRADELAIEISSDTNVIELTYAKAPSSYTFSIYGLNEERLKKLCAMIGHTGYMYLPNRLAHGVNEPIGEKIKLTPSKLQRWNCNINVHVCFTDHLKMVDMLYIILEKIVSKENLLLMMDSIDYVDVEYIKKFMKTNYGIKT